MKKFLQLMIVILMFFIVGCNTPEPSNLNIYLEQLEVQEATNSNFYLPRVLNSEEDHVITWKSSNEEVLTIGNIMSIVGIDHYFIEVVRGEEDVTVNLTATIDMINGESAEKEFAIVIKEDTSIKDAKIKYVKEILAQYHNLEIKESINLPVVTKEYGLEIVWSSSNNDVLNSRGEYKAPDVNTTVEMTAVIKDSGKEIYKEVIKIVAINKTSVEKEIVLDFAANFDSFASNWDSSYAERKVNNTDLGLDLKMSVTLSRANRQAAGNAISDRPVIAGKSSTEYITIQIEEGSFKTIAFSLMQWTTKTFNDIHMEYYDGTTWVKCSDNFTVPGDIICNSLPSNTTKVRVCVKTTASKNTQLGLSSIQFELN